MEVDLQSFLGSMSRDLHSCTHWLRPRNPPPPPPFGLIYEGAIDQPRKIDGISLTLDSHTLVSRLLLINAANLVRNVVIV